MRGLQAVRELAQLLQGWAQAAHIMATRPLYPQQSQWLIVLNSKLFDVRDNH